MPTRENIKVLDPNFTTDGSHFYCLIKDAQVLQVKTDDGNVAFSYPANTAVTNTVNALEWDGVFFWSLENKTGGGIIIRKWAIDGYILRQVNSFTFTDGGGHLFSTKAMAIESYALTVGDNDNGGGGYTVGMDTIKLSDVSTIEVGDTLYFVKNRTQLQSRYGSSYVEVGVVDGILPATKQVELTSVMSADPHGDGKGFRGPLHSPGPTESASPDLVYVTKNIWLLNDNTPGNPGTGALYKIDADNGSHLVQYSGVQYSSIEGASFYTTYNVLGTVTSDDVYNTTIYSQSQYVMFAKSSTLSMFNVETAQIEKALILDNLKDNETDTWDVFDLTSSGHEEDALGKGGVSLLRLQNGTTYGDPAADESWSTAYSYEKTLIRRVVTSISVTAEPAIVPTNGAVSEITAIVLDQYGNPAVGKTVSWSDDSGDNRVSPSSSTTNSFGRARATYTSGLTEDDVKITAGVADGLI